MDFGPFFVLGDDLARLAQSDILGFERDWRGRTFWVLSATGAVGHFGFFSATGAVGHFGFF